MIKFITILAALFNVAGSLALKEWAKNSVSIYLIIAIIFYGVDTAFWAYVLKQGAQISTGGAIWNAVQVLLVVVLGYSLFKEIITTKQIIGVGFILMGIITIG